MTAVVSSQQPSAKDTDKTIKILLVDDMSNFLDLEVSFLRRSDCTIITANDGIDALKKAKTERPDIILLDIEMPRMTGIECCRIIKSDPTLKKTPVIMVTSTSKREESFAAGADDFWQKPISEAHFLDGIKKFVNIRDRQDKRVAVGLQVDYRFGENQDKVVQAFSKDVSRGGMFVITRDTLPIGSRLEVEFTLPGVPKIKTLVEIVREIKDESDGHYIGGMGMRFIELTAEEQRNLDAFLEKH